MHPLPAGGQLVGQLAGAVRRRVVDHQHVAGERQPGGAPPSSAPPCGAGCRAPCTSGARSGTRSTSTGSRADHCPGDQATTPNNAEIAGRFELLADLLELDGAVVYRYLAYRKAAKTMRETPESVARLSEQGRLRELAGGRRHGRRQGRRAARHGQHLGAGEARVGNAAGMVPVMHIPGIGPKTARRIFADLGLVTLEDAVAAAREGRIRDLPGLGENGAGDPGRRRVRRLGAGRGSRSPACGRWRRTSATRCSRCRPSTAARSRAASAGTPRPPRTSTWCRVTAAPTAWWTPSSPTTGSPRSSSAARPRSPASLTTARASSCGWSRRACSATCCST